MINKQRISTTKEQACACTKACSFVWKYAARKRTGRKTPSGVFLPVALLSSRTLLKVKLESGVPKWQRDIESSNACAAINNIKILIFL